MENKKERFEIIVKDTQTGESKVAITCGDDWTDMDDRQFTATIDDVIDRIVESDESGALFGI